MFDERERSRDTGQYYGRQNKTDLGCPENLYEDDARTRDEQHVEAEHGPHFGPVSSNRLKYPMNLTPKAQR